MKILWCVPSLKGQSTYSYHTGEQQKNALGNLPKTNANIKVHLTLYADEFTYNRYLLCNPPPSERGRPYIVSLDICWLSFCR